LNKAPDAFRTISEVADDLDLPQHVLRFWESRFPQIRPMKRGGGRRYYRPEDIDLLRGIRHLLYGEGYTIRGVQRILREQGLRTVQSVGQGRTVPLPEPSNEDAETGAEAGPGMLKFVPPLFSGTVAQSDDAAEEAETPDEDDADVPRSARTGVGRGAAESGLPANVPEARMAPETLAPQTLAPDAMAPIVGGLAPEDMDRLKAALRRLEECRALLDQAGGGG
jgi:DNA-binding transcriptional MerR regulator